MVFKNKNISYKDKIMELIKNSYISQPKSFDCTNQTAIGFLFNCVSCINKNFGDIVFILKSVFNFNDPDLQQWSTNFNKYVSTNYDKIMKIEHYCITDGFCSLTNDSKQTIIIFIQELNRYVNELSNICSNAFLKTARNPIENTVFLVHGHNEVLKNTLFKELKKKGYNPIVLSNKDESGITLLDKFIKYANQATKAIIIMTKDDLIKKNNDEFYQARPNVFIEFGYFLNMLERKDIIVIFEKGCIMPSDVNGVSYLEYTSCTKVFVSKVLNSISIS